MIGEDPDIPILLLDILRGYSKITYKSKDYFFRHFRVYDSLNLLEFEAESLSSAMVKGIKNKEQLIAKAIERKDWSKEEEGSIENLQWMIRKSEEAASKISDYTIKKTFEKSIKDQRNQLEELESRRHSIVLHCAENLALRKKNKREISQNLFQDEKMEVLVEEDNLFSLMPSVYEKIDLLTEEKNLLKAAFIPSFFDTYCLMYRQPHEMIRADIFTISLWQKNLLFYASVLLNKLKNMEIPENIKDDPVKIFKFLPREEKENSGSVVHGVEDLKAKMAKNGGKLEAEDF